MTSKTLTNAIERADQVLAAARETHDLDHLFAAVSGGHDSHTALDVVHRSAELDLDGVVYIDTGISIPETKAFARTEAEKRGLEFHVVGSDYRLPQEEYESLVLVFGFPGPPIHSDMFWSLKGKPLDRFSKEIDGDVGYISGVLADESENRMENIGDEPIQEKDHATWISPLFDWLESTVDRYRERYDLATNDVTEQLHVSGDCLCAAFGAREELRDLNIFYPEIAQKIARLEREVIKRANRGQIPADYALYGHGRTDERTLNAKQDGAQETFDMCSGCEKRCESPYELDAGSETQYEAYLKHDDHDIGGPTPVYCVDCDMVVGDGQAHRDRVHPDAGASPKDLDIRAIPSRCGWTCLTEGTISTKNPHGKVCHERGECHDFEVYDGRNGVADYQCTKCGAFEMSIPAGEYDPAQAVKNGGIPLSIPKFEQATPIEPEPEPGGPAKCDSGMSVTEFAE